jgi:hypothetical protein
LPLLADQECWRDTDCDPGFHCDGETVCECRESCDVESRPGRCSPVPEGCCSKRSDCVQDENPENWYSCAITSGDSFGACKRYSVHYGKCWSDWDCGSDQICHGSNVCSCESTIEPCEDIWGVCMDWPL